MSDKEFVDGLIVKPPHANAPDFVKGAISIKRKDLGNWLRQKDDDWINLQILETKDKTKWYAQVDTWKPEKKEAPAPAPPAAGFDDDIPFAPSIHERIL